MRRLMPLLFLVLFSGRVFAWSIDEYDKQVAAVGAHSVTNGYVRIVGALAYPQCANGVLYFDVSTSLGKAMLATLLVAKTSGQNVRIGYTPPASGVGLCTLELAAVGDGG